MSYRLELEIRTKPPLLSNRMVYSHWRRAYAEKRRWLELVGAHTAGKRPRKPLQRARIRAVRLSSRQPDPDTAGTGFKWLLDALVALRVLQDDSAKHVVEFECGWEYARGSAQGIKLTVEELP